MAELRIVGSEWADRYPDRFVDIDPPPPRPCPLCGDLKGACHPEDDDDTEAAP